MQNLSSKKEKYHFHNYLTCLVKSLENQHTIIDLRNESCVSGLIKHVDGLMNVEMENVIFYDPRGQEHTFKDFYISARNIRYVHIPDGLSPIQLMENQISSLRSVTNRQQPKKDTFKTKRAKKYHEDIVKNLKWQQPGPSNA